MVRTPNIVEPIDGTFDDVSAAMVKPGAAKQLDFHGRLDTIDFHGQVLQIVDGNGRPYVPIRRICVR